MAAAESEDKFPRGRAGEGDLGGDDPAALARSLEPELIDACAGRLRDVNWFRSTWQAGGAATAYARFDRGSRGECRVILKIPVGPHEYRWTVGAGADDGPLGRVADAALPTPRVLASGLEIGGRDLAWLVIERFEGGTLASGLDKRAVEQLIETACEWYVLAERVMPVAGTPPPPDQDWESLLARARTAIRDQVIEDAQRWNAAVKRTQKSLPTLLNIWRGRVRSTWCHGDLHPGNAMRRRCETGAAHGDPSADARCVLIDLGLVHAGHWVEDAVYLERLFWGRKELLCGVRPVNHMARARRERGLNVGDEYMRIADARRVLMAACAPAFMAHEGHPKHLRAALEMLERILPTLGA